MCRMRIGSLNEYM